jgi:hypothetical protein
MRPAGGIFAASDETECYLHPVVADQDTNLTEGSERQWFHSEGLICNQTGDTELLQISFDQMSL